MIDFLQDLALLASQRHHLVRSSGEEAWQVWFIPYLVDVDAPFVPCSHSTDVVAPIVQIFWWRCSSRSACSRFLVCSGRRPSGAEGKGKDHIYTVLLGQRNLLICIREIPLPALGLKMGPVGVRVP